MTHPEYGDLLMSLDDAVRIIAQVWEEAGGPLARPWQSEEERHACLQELRDWAAERRNGSGTVTFKEPAP